MGRTKIKRTSLRITGPTFSSESVPPSSSGSMPKLSSGSMPKLSSGSVHLRVGVFKNLIQSLGILILGASCANVPEDIKNRPNMDDDVIISDDEVVEDLSDEDADNDFEQAIFAAHLIKKVPKYNKVLDFFSS
ncbi:hypothetical protein AVEN_193487-1 [Araneus ventricosus]|uniref:Uncharacterized protein n=1 Tax=Araneus ventricosus TaxID=182803 RepID=A0A4Y2UH00_ARAVE|nr:hypothetical protein AVEN_193487-1 [Araneus ventricosus]